MTITFFMTDGFHRRQQARNYHVANDDAVTIAAVVAVAIAVAVAIVVAVVVSFCGKQALCKELGIEAQH